MYSRNNSRISLEICYLTDLSIEKVLLEPRNIFESSPPHDGGISYTIVLYCYILLTTRYLLLG